MGKTEILKLIAVDLGWLYQELTIKQENKGKKQGGGNRKLKINGEARKM